MTLSRDDVYELVKDVKAMQPEDLESEFRFENISGHEYSPFNSMFLLMQGAIEYYPEAVADSAHHPVVAGGKNQWHSLGRQIKDEEWEKCFYIWVPSMKRKQAVERLRRARVSEEKKKDLVKRHRFYLCQVWLRPQTEEVPS